MSRGERGAHRWFLFVDTVKRDFKRIEHSEAAYSVSNTLKHAAQRISLSLRRLRLFLGASFSLPGVSSPLRGASGTHQTPPDTFTASLRRFATICDDLRRFATFCDVLRRFATFCDYLGVLPGGCSSATRSNVVFVVRVVFRGFDYGLEMVLNGVGYMKVASRKTVLQRVGFSAMRRQGVRIRCSHSKKCFSGS